jgi:ArsR family transcriptional regulator
MDQIIQIFKALSDETRLRILIMVSRRSICAKGIAKHLGISEAAVSQHMKVLKDAGIIQSEKTGYFVKYTIQEQHLYAIVDFIKELENKEPSMGCKLDKHVPNGCAAECKGHRNRCCQN